MITTLSTIVFILIMLITYAIGYAHGSDDEFHKQWKRQHKFQKRGSEVSNGD